MFDAYVSTGEAFALAAIVGYLAGSIPFGLILTKLAGVGDIRGIGSGNIGATNVLRTGRKGLATATLLLDAAKGAAVVALGHAQSIDVAAVAGFAAVVGHNFPMWLKFKGGKGVATTVGALLAISWPVGLAVCATWMAMAAATRYSSLAALVALVAAPVLAWWLSNTAVITLAAALAVLGVARHHENIRRLLKGEESRIGQKRAD